MNWLKSPHRMAVTLALVAQILVFLGVSRNEKVPARPPLAQVPYALGSWNRVQEGVVEKETLDLLRADEVLSRLYQSDSLGSQASLFVAYFRTQRTGAAPHSPKNCLPGSGWTPSVSDTVAITIAGRAAPVRVNRYVVSKGDARSLVLYWYQSRGRVIANEFEAKFYLVADAIRHNRTDTALVRVVIPMAGEDGERATRTAIGFVQAAFAPLNRHIGG